MITIAVVTNYQNYYNYMVKLRLCGSFAFMQQKRVGVMLNFHTLIQHK